MRVSLFHKILAIVVGPLVVTVTVVMMLNISQLEHFAGDKSKAEITKDLAYYTLELETFVGEHISMLQTIARSPILQERDIKKVIDYLKNEEHRLGDRAIRVNFIDDKGNVHRTNGHVFGVKDRPFYRTILDYKDALLVGPITSRATNERIVLALVPVFDDKMQRWGSLSGAIIVDKIHAKLKNMKVGKSGVAVLFNHEGQLIHKGLDEKIDSLWREAISQNDMPFFGGPSVVAVGPKSLTFTFDGLKFHLIHKQLHNANWSLGFIRDNKEVQAAVTRIRWTTVAILVSALLLAILAVWHLHRELIKPLRQLMAAHNLFRHSRAGKVVKLAGQVDNEIAALFESFNQMTVDIVRESNLREKSESQLNLVHSAMNNISEAVMITRFLGNRKDLPIEVLYINPAFTAMTGYVLEDFNNGLTPRFMLGPDSDLQLFERTYGTLMESRFAQGRTVFYRKDRSSFHCEYSTTPIPGPDGKTESIVSTFRDVTEKISTERQLLHAQKMEVVGKLTGGIAHDFNNLLAIIKGSLELMVVDFSDLALLQRYLQPALRATNRGSELTQRLLTFSRRQILTPRTVNLHELLNETIKLLKRTMGGRVEIVLDLASDLKLIAVDLGQLENAIINIAINARDAMPEGGRLEISASNFWVNANDTSDWFDLSIGNYVKLVFMDTGHGIEPEHLNRVFEPFYTTKGESKGTGLGLSTVYGFVRQSGGQIRVTSEVGRGTTVSICFPCSELVMAEGLLRDTDLNDDALVEGEGERVLLVEDNHDVREVLTRVLTRLNYRVVAVASAMEAMDRLSSDHAIDLVFTDIMLGKGMNGMELGRSIKSQSPTIKVLYMSGFTEERTSDVTFLQKPFKVTDMSQKIAHLLRQPSALSS